MMHMEKSFYLFQNIVISNFVYLPLDNEISHQIQLILFTLVLPVLTPCKIYALLPKLYWYCARRKFGGSMKIYGESFLAYFTFQLNDFIFD